ncbi:MAG TPA: hypothetical protein VGF06_02785 [Terriglobales bacterium]
MKLRNGFKGLVLGLALLLTTTAFAANKGSLQISDPTSVAGKQLAAGDYTVQWEGSGPSVEVSILKGKKVVATVPARVTSLDQASSYNSAVVTKSSDGGRTLSQIRFSGKKFALQIGDEGSAGMGGNSN